MSAVTDVEEYVRWQPDVNYIQIYEGLGGRYSASRVDSILRNLYTQGILMSRRDHYTLEDGKRVRLYFYTHVLTYRGLREEVSEGGGHRWIRGCSSPSHM